MDLQKEKAIIADIAAISIILVAHGGWHQGSPVSDIDT
jgi:hypothetical protein